MLAAATDKGLRKSEIPQADHRLMRIAEIAIAEVPAILGVSHTPEGMLKSPYLGSFKLHYITIFLKGRSKKQRGIARAARVALFSVSPVGDKVGTILNRQDKPIGDNERPHVFLMQKPCEHDGRVDTKKKDEKLAHFFFAGAD